MQMNIYIYSFILNEYIVCEYIHIFTYSKACLNLPQACQAHDVQNQSYHFSSCNLISYFNGWPHAFCNCPRWHPRNNPSFFPSVPLDLIDDQILLPSLFTNLVQTLILFLPWATSFL